MSELSLITVTPDTKRAQFGLMSCGDKNYVCRLGRRGVHTKKEEGDGATPAGRYKLRYALYRADRTKPPRTALRTTPASEDDGWCDDPTDGFYNQAVKLPYPARAEAMWREDHQYDVVIVIGYNDEPVVAGRGSAIFIHLISDEDQPTAGCIALGPADIREVLERVGPETVIEIRENDS